VDIDTVNDVAHLAFTGGTTGLSKGVVLTHAKASVERTIKIKSGDYNIIQTS
jgi:long-subunit acyl-CoA synthetase (AMP-forming)